MTVEFALTASITLAALAWFTFLVWYSVRAKWWKHLVGQNTFGVSLILFVILARLTVIRIAPDFKDSAISGVFIYLAALGLGVQRIVFMEKAQRENRTKRSV